MQDLLTLRWAGPRTAGAVSPKVGANRPRVGSAAGFSLHQQRVAQFFQLDRAILQAIAIDIDFDD